jgi:HEAT repeat protein
MPQCGPDGKYTGPAPDVTGKAVAQVLAGGKDALAALIGMLKDPGAGEDYKARYLLHATATRAAGPGMDKERQLLCESLADGLGKAQSPVVRAYLIEELKWIGGSESAAAVAGLLLDAKLWAPAVDALVAMRAPGAFREALPKAREPAAKAAMIQALGVLRDAQATDALIASASATDPNIALAAVEALANIGDPKAVDVVLKAADPAGGTYGHLKSAEAALRLGQRLAESGRKADATAIYTSLGKRYVGKEGRHVRAGCLWGLSVLAEGEPMPELLAAMADGDAQVRAVAGRIAATLPGGAAVDKWLALLAKAPARDRAGILFVLGAIGDAKALPAVLAAMDDAQEPVRLEAMRSAAAIGGPKAAEALVARLLGAKGAEQDTAAEALAAARGEEAGAASAAAMAKTTDAGIRARFIGVLAGRRAIAQTEAVASTLGDSDAGVRIAALRAMAVLGAETHVPAVLRAVKEARSPEERDAAEGALIAIGQQAPDKAAAAVVAALPAAQGDQAGALLRVLVRLGGAEAANAVVAGADSSDPKTRDDAVDALATWSSPRGLTEAGEGLLKIAEGSREARHQVLALRAYVRLSRSREWNRPLPELLKAYERLLKAARRADEKRVVLGALAGMGDAQAVRLAAASLDDKEVGEEAAAAVVAAAARVRNKADGDVQAAVRRVLKTSRKDDTLAAARKLVIEKP